MIVNLNVAILQIQNKLQKRRFNSNSPIFQIPSNLPKRMVSDALFYVQKYLYQRFNQMFTSGL